MDKNHVVLSNLDRGGLWINIELDGELNYKNYFAISVEKKDSKYFLTDSTISLTEDWIDWLAIGNKFGKLNGDADKVAVLCDYYGVKRFGGTEEQYDNVIDLVKRLESLGLKIYKE